MTRPEPQPRVVILTPQQRVVLGHLTWDGAEDAIIAARMGLAVNTVKHHMKGIFRAFDAGSRAAVVAECLRGRVRVRVVDGRSSTEREEAAA